MKIPRLLMAVGLTALWLLQASSPALAEYVRGYTRRDGTYVSGYNRSSRDNTVRNNYSYSGNVNPYTGQTGSNRYVHSPSSEFFDGNYGWSSNNDSNNYDGN